MRKTNTMTVSLSSRETWLGWGYMILYLAVLPRLLSRFLSQYGALTVNVAFFALNFVAIILIFRHFLADSLAPIGKAPGRFLAAAAGGFCVLLLLDALVGLLFSWLAPGFSNVNDASISAFYHSSPVLVGLCVGLLVPPVEECLFRGLIFQGLYRTNRTGAYCLSILAFCALHTLSYVSAYPGQTLLLCFVQYIPAGLVLAWAYERTNSIFAPILIHAAANVVGILAMR